MRNGTFAVHHPLYDKKPKKRKCPLECFRITSRSCSEKAIYMKISPFCLIASSNFCWITSSSCGKTSLSVRITNFSCWTTAQLKRESLQDNTPILQDNKSFCRIIHHYCRITCLSSRIARYSCKVTCLPCRKTRHSCRIIRYIAEQHTLLQNNESPYRITCQFCRIPSASCNITRHSCRN
jgi:hypothetical protein